MSTRPALLVALTGATALILGLALGAWWNRGVGEGAGEAAVAEPGDPRPELALADLDGDLRRIGEWDGRVLLVNFWATWCPPCKKEMPAFIELQRTYGERGLQVIGVAIDQPGPVREFAEEIGVNYPLLVGEAEAAEISRRWGNRLGALPYTVFVDRQGRIAARHHGEISAEQAESVVQDLL